jgi:LacI family transcriptional regulator
MVDVARTAGVSVSTVSHVVNGTRHVEPATRERVETAIRELGYRQDALARAMKRAQSDSIGLVVSDPAEPAFADMVRGVEQEAAKQGLTLLLAASGEDPDHERRAIEVLLARRVDGLILARASGSDDAVLDDLAREKMPVVLMDRLYDVALDQVGVRNREAMAELIGGLLRAGHRSVVLVAGDLTVPTLRERHLGYLDALAAQGLSEQDARVLAGDVDLAGAREAVHALLAGGPAPTAVVTSSTVLAAGALTALAEAGLHTPDDLAFATFDGFAYADLFQPHLTTVRQPAHEVGAQALRMLVERIADPAAAPRTVRLDPVIEHRRSTEHGPDVAIPALVD